MRYWTCVNFSRYIPVEIAPQLCNELIKICLTSGVVFEINPVLTIQCAEPVTGDCTSRTDLERAKAAGPEDDRSFPNRETVMLNRNVSRNKSEEISKVADLTDEHREGSRLSATSEGIHPATSKSKKIVLGPEAPLNDCAVQKESQNNTAAMKDNKSMKECGLLEVAECVFATPNHKMDTDKATETPLGGLGVLLWKAMHASTLTLLAISNEVSGRQMTRACYTDQPMNPRVGQTNDSGLWTKEGCWIYFV
jgi:hypothetical protein